MPTENKPTEPFHREDRYIVIKRRDLAAVPVAYRSSLVEPMFSLQPHLPHRECLVIESDWPEYEPVWQMIERRVTGANGGQPEVVAVINEEGEHFKETVVEHRPGIDLLPVGTELVDRAHVIRLQAERDALQLRLNAPDQRIDDLERDKDRLDAIEANFWDVRHHSSALGDTGDYTSSIEIIGHWMDKPIERVIGEDYGENLRAAIDQAMAAPAYPPARPEYPELDAALNTPQ